MGYDYMIPNIQSGQARPPDNDFGWNIGENVTMAHAGPNYIFMGINDFEPIIRIESRSRYWSKSGTEWTDLTEDQDSVVIKNSVEFNEIMEKLKYAGEKFGWNGVYNGL